MKTLIPIIISLLTACGQTTKSSTEKTIDSLNHSFPRPEQFTPITFLNSVSEQNDASNGHFTPSMSMIEEFPLGWVRIEHIDTLISLLDSKDKCGCFVNPLSSNLPTGYAEKGGYAAAFINSYKNNVAVDFGLYSCPKVDRQLNEELLEWWAKERVE